MTKVLNCLLDNRFGGPQKRAYILAQKLQKYNIETVFLFNQKNKKYIVCVKGFKCFLLKHIQCITRNSTIINFILFCLLFAYNFYKCYMIIKREKIDIVHTNGILNIVPVFAATLSRVKVVWHLNDTLTPWILRKLFLPLVKLLSEKVALASKKVGEHYFRKHNKLWNKSIVFYAPVDTKKFDSDSIDTKKIIDIKAEINISADDLVIGTIGNINMAKGYEYFIEAASYLKREENRAKFVVVGAKLDSRVDYYRKICNLIHYFHLEKDVILTGFRSDIVEILSIFDVFVLSSVSEACPLVVLEALAMKVPVVATNVGGVSEQIIHNENGILVEPFRSDLLAEGILRIINLSKKDLQKMVNTGRERVEKIFSPDKITKKYKDVYAKVLG